MTASETEVTDLMKQWEDQRTWPSFNPVPILKRLAEIVEAETDIFLKSDPDPFDDRPPIRSHPNAVLGKVLQQIHRCDEFCETLVHEYARCPEGLVEYHEEHAALFTAALRLMLDITPSFENTPIVTVPDEARLLEKLFFWAQNDLGLLGTYAFGLLAHAVHGTDLAMQLKRQNHMLVHYVMYRMQEGFKQAQSETKKQPITNGFGNMAPFAQFRKGNVGAPVLQNGDVAKSFSSGLIDDLDECSNSSWTDIESLVFNGVQMHPASVTSLMVFMLRYATSLCEYHEFLTPFIEYDPVPLLLEMISKNNWVSTRLTFETLKFLGGLVGHKKFAIEFITKNGIQILTDIPRPGVASTGASYVLMLLAQCEEAMERICNLPKAVITKLVKYALWIMECGHDSAKCHALLFFGLSFQFRLFLKEFDANSGLTCIYNTISTYPLLNDTYELEEVEEDETAMRQIVRHVCTSLKRYLEAHLSIKAENLQRAYLRDSDISQCLNVITSDSCKSQKKSLDEIREEINVLLNPMFFKSNWGPVDKFLNLGGLKMLLKILCLAYDWNYSGRAETVRGALDAINVCTVMPKALLTLCEKIRLRDGSMTTGMAIIIGAAEGDVVPDAGVQISALNVIVTCTCTPIVRDSSSPGMASTSTPFLRKRSSLNMEEVIVKVWECFRSCNGIMSLINLVCVKTPIMDADYIRALACQALAGLARNETIKQIISQIPLITLGHLQQLMKDPILEDKQYEFAQFQTHAIDLLDKVCGKAKRADSDLVSSANIYKANIVAQTKINFQPKQLLELIHHHLLNKGLLESASALQKEADLPPINNLQNAYKTPSKRSGGFPNNVTWSSPCITVNTALGRPHRSVNNGRIHASIERVSPMYNRFKPLEQTPPLDGRDSKDSQTTGQSVTLESIVTDHLATQHSRCKNPIVTCPQFDLFTPHICPTTISQKAKYKNFTSRYQLGIKIPSLDYRLVHTRFCPIRSIRAEVRYFTNCQFLSQRALAVGTATGSVQLYDIISSKESVFPVHQAYITAMGVNRSGTLMSVASTWRSPLSSVWRCDLSTLKLTEAHRYDDDELLEFAWTRDDRGLGTSGAIANIYDMVTGRQIISLKPRESNRYNKNRAVFDYTDDLVLSDGVLWDFRAGKEIHKFDKLNLAVSGVFHPNNLEIISNTEVWDVRTFKLLRTVPCLDQCNVTFPRNGYTFYTDGIEKESDDDPAFETSFRCIDAKNYSLISTNDVGKMIYGLSCNPSDTQIAIIENSGHYDSVDDSVLKIYSVGRKKETDDDWVDSESSDDGASDEEEDTVEMAVGDLLDGLDDDDSSDESGSSSTDSE